MQPDRRLAGPRAEIRYIMCAMASTARKRTKPGPRGSVRSKGSRVTRTEWMETLECLRQGYTVARTSRETGIDTRTVTKMFEHGLPYGHHWGADRPMRAVLAEEEVAARAARQDLRASGASPELTAATEQATETLTAVGMPMPVTPPAPPGAQAAAQMNPGVPGMGLRPPSPPLDSTASRARDDGVTVRMQESTLIEINRLNAISIAGSLAELSKTAKEITRRVRAQIIQELDSEGGLKPTEALNMLYRIASITERSTTIARNVIDMEAMRMGNADKAARINPGVAVADIPMNEAVKGLERTLSLFERMKAKGLSVVNGGDEAPRAPSAEPAQAPVDNEPEEELPEGEPPPELTEPVMSPPIPEREPLPADIDPLAATLRNIE